MKEVEPYSKNSINVYWIAVMLILGLLVSLDYHNKTIY